MSINNPPLNRIDQFKYWAHKVMPLVYDESLSYYEFLCKVVAKLNEVIDNNDNMITGFEAITTEVNAWENETDDKYNEFVRTTDNLIDEFMQSEVDAREEFETTETNAREEFEANETNARELFETEMRGIYNTFLENYNRQFGITNLTGDSITDAISQDCVTGNLSELFLANGNSFSTLTQGGVGLDGATNNYTTRARTSGLVRNSNTIKRLAFECVSDTYQIVVACYNGTPSTNTFIGFVPASFTNKKFTLPYTCTNFILVAKRIDGASINSTEYSTIISSINVYKYTDETLAISNAPADAKTIGDIMLFEENMTPNLYTGKITTAVLIVMKTEYTQDSTMEGEKDTSRDML